MSIIRVNIDIEIVEGGTFNKIYQWTQGVPLAPIDLTGCSVHMQVRAKIKDTEPTIDFPFIEADWTADGLTGIYIYNDEYDPGDTGKWRIYLKDEDSKGICPSHKDVAGVYDLFIYSASGEAVLQQYGVATLRASVTRDE